jgi:hypothetical protein
MATMFSRKRLDVTLDVQFLFFFFGFFFFNESGQFWGTKTAAKGLLLLN